MPDAPDLWTWITIPAIGGLIGWSTNWLAVKMIFLPVKPRRLLFFRLQGLVPRRQQALPRARGQRQGVDRHVEGAGARPARADRQAPLRRARHRD